MVNGLLHCSSEYTVYIVGWDILQIILISEDSFNIYTISSDISMVPIDPVYWFVACETFIHNQLLFTLNLRQMHGWSNLAEIVEAIINKNDWMVYTCMHSKYSYRVIKMLQVIPNPKLKSKNRWQFYLHIVSVLYTYQQNTTLIQQTIYACIVNCW